MKRIAYLLVIAFTLLTAPAASLAQQSTWPDGTFAMLGVIGGLERESIILSDLTFRLSPTVKVSVANNPNAGVGRLKTGQLVGYKVIVINRRILVDHIWLVPENERRLYNPN